MKGIILLLTIFVCVTNGYPNRDGNFIRNRIPINRVFRGGNVITPRRDNNIVYVQRQIHGRMFGIPAGGRNVGGFGRSTLGIARGHNVAIVNIGAPKIGSSVKADGLSVQTIRPNVGGSNVAGYGRPGLSGKQNVNTNIGRQSGGNDIAGFSRPAKTVNTGVNVGGYGQKINKGIPNGSGNAGGQNGGTSTDQYGQNIQTGIPNGGGNAGGQNGGINTDGYGQKIQTGIIPNGGGNAGGQNGGTNTDGYGQKIQTEIPNGGGNAGGQNGGTNTDVYGQNIQTEIPNGGGNAGVQNEGTSTNQYDQIGNNGGSGGSNIAGFSRPGGGEGISSSNGGGGGGGGVKTYGKQKQITVHSGSIFDNGGLNSIPGGGVIGTGVTADNGGVLGNGGVTDNVIATDNGVVNSNGVPNGNEVISTNGTSTGNGEVAFNGVPYENNVIGNGIVTNNAGAAANVVVPTGNGGVMDSGVVGLLGNSIVTGNNGDFGKSSRKKYTKAKNAGVVNNNGGFGRTGVPSKADGGAKIKTYGDVIPEGAGNNFAPVYNGQTNGGSDSLSTMPIASGGMGSDGPPNSVTGAGNIDNNRNTIRNGYGSNDNNVNGGNDNERVEVDITGKRNMYGESNTNVGDSSSTRNNGPGYGKRENVVDREPNRGQVIENVPNNIGSVQAPSQLKIGNNVQRQGSGIQNPGTSGNGNQAPVMNSGFSSRFPGGFQGTPSRVSVPNNYMVRPNRRHAFNVVQIFHVGQQRDLRVRGNQIRRPVIPVRRPMVRGGSVSRGFPRGGPTVQRIIPTYNKNIY